MAAKPDKLIGTRLDGRYDIVGHVAMGGYGTVYRARQVHLGRDVALKVVHAVAAPQHHARLEREARLLASLDHPNVVPVHDGGVLPDGRPYLVESLLEGRSLREVLVRDGALSNTRAVALVLQLLAGLGAAHALGVVHRDIKPPNLMLVERDGDESLRLIDFGIARAPESNDAMQTLTATGMVIGTPAYMAPEQIRGGEIGPSTDLYAVGVLLYELLTGRPPFRHVAAIDTLQAHLGEAPPPLPSSVPQPLALVVMKALAKAPGDRYASAEAMAAALAMATGDGLGLDERYEMLGPLGRGNFGDVFLARHRVLGREVAIKISTAGNEDTEARFVREARIMATLQHPGLVTLRDFGTLPDRRLFMVQDLVEGETLEALLAREGALPVERAVRLTLGILEPLEAAHDQGIVHRDIKPANILIEPGDHVRLIDFGLARPATADEEALTTQGLFVGTVAYASPEQSTGDPITALSDLYAVGIVLHEMLVGKPPFVADRLVDVLLMHRQQPLPTLPASIDRHLDAVVRRATAKAPSARFPSAAAMAEALLGPAEAPTRPRRWRRTLLVAGALAAFLGLIGLMSVVESGAGTEPEPEPADAEPLPIQIGNGPPGYLLEPFEEGLAGCDCDRTWSLLNELRTRNPDGHATRRERWEKACAGASPTCSNVRVP